MPKFRVSDMIDTESDHAEIRATRSWYQSKGQNTDESRRNAEYDFIDNHNRFP